MGAFSSPHDYHSLMAAVVGYSDKSVEDVQAEIEQRNSDSGTRKGRQPRDVNSTAGPTKSQTSALDELVAKAKAVQEDPG